MFKKPIKVSAQNQLSGKDRKSVRNKLSTQFDPAAIQALLGQHEKITCAKVSGNKMLIFMGDDYPLFVDGTGKDDFFPSIYTCTAYQPLAKSLTINEGVEAYIFNGANLMWPGVRDISNLGEFKTDQVVAIRNSSGNLIAVGALSCSLVQLKKNQEGGGVAVHILHYKGDRLWDMGTKMYPDVIIKVEQPQLEAQEPVKEESTEVPLKEINQKEEEVLKDKQGPVDSGKTKGKKTKKQEVKKESEDSQSEDDLDFGAMLHTKKTNNPIIKMEVKKKVTTFDDDDENDKKGKKKAGKKPVKKRQQSEKESEEDVVAEEVKKPKGKKGKGKKRQNDSEEEKKEQPSKKQPKKKEEQGEQAEQQAEKEQKSAISGHIMDEYFKQAFLNVLKLTKLDLPVDSGRFFSDYMVFAKSDENQLSIKDSSFKKLGKFYEEMAKLKFIQFKPSKEKKGQQGSTITKILWDNQQLKNYVPTIRKLGQKEVQEKQEIFSKEKLVLSKNMNVQIVYKLNKDLQNILIPPKKINYMPDHSEDEEDESKKEKEVFFTDRELKQKIDKYLNDIAIKEKEDKKEGGKERKNDKLITLNYKGHPSIAKLLKNQIEEYQQNLEKEEILGGNDSDQEEGKKKGKKDKRKQGVLRIERGFVMGKILKWTHPYYKLFDTETGFSKFRQGHFKGIQLITDKVMNKNVTKIIGLETFIPSTFKEDQIVKQIHGFSHYLQVKFASSSAVQNLPGKNAGKQIIIQGNFVEQFEAIFMTEYGIKKECITVHNKLGKKKKH